ncbi:MAG: hypothetical protein OXI35_00105 [Gemmatimonadota bacterium]|nr:hypothetical protein [Gemmatimonadota bacterium]
MGGRSGDTRTPPAAQSGGTGTPPAQGATSAAIWGGPRLASAVGRWDGQHGAHTRREQGAGRLAVG